jgi:hypothetical protein
MKPGELEELIRLRSACRKREWSVNRYCGVLPGDAIQVEMTLAEWGYVVALHNADTLKEVKRLNDALADAVAKADEQEELAKEFSRALWNVREARTLTRAKDIAIEATR